MAARHQLGCAKLFKISRTLFTQEDGAPHKFYFEDQLQDLNEIIHRGAGEVTESADEANFLLSENASDHRGHLPLEFIVDCVKKNAFLDTEKYRQHDKTQPQPSTSTAQDGDNVESDEDIFLQASPLRVDRSGLAGRSKYTDAEDFKIIRYLINNKRYRDTGGNVVWKQMQAAKVTDHTHQSMKARFKRIILPDIDSYDIPDRWKTLLSGGDMDWIRSRRLPDRSESPEIDLTFESLEAWKQCKRLKKSVSNVQERRSSTGNTVSNVQERRSSTGNTVSNVQERWSSTRNTVSNVQEHRSSAGNTVSNVQDRRSNAGNTVSNVQESRSNAGNISRFNFLQDDDDLNTQELDELDQLIVHEIHGSSRPGEDRCESAKQFQWDERVPSEPAGTEPSQHAVQSHEPLHSSTPGPSKPTESDGPPVKRAKTLSVLNLSPSSDEESVVSKDFGLPRLSKFLSSQTLIEDQQSGTSPTSRSSQDESQDFRIAKRRVNVISQLYGLTKEQAIQLLLKLDGDFLAAMLFLEMRP